MTTNRQKHVYTAKDGEKLHMLCTGALVVVHPDREPFIIMPGGERRDLKGAAK